MSSHFSLGWAFLGAATIAMLVSDTAARSSANEPDPESVMSKALVILKSTPSFQEARSMATRAAERLGVQLNLRDLAQSEKIGLTFSNAECDENGFPFPCYVPRGRYDDGVYVSIEYSNAYPGFKKGLYVVVLASGDVDAVRPTLVQARRAYPDAYLKITKVYMGCIH